MGICPFDTFYTFCRPNRLVCTKKCSVEGPFTEKNKIICPFYTFCWPDRPVCTKNCVVFLLIDRKIIQFVLKAFRRSPLRRKKQDYLPIFILFAGQIVRFVLKSLFLTLCPPRRQKGNRWPEIGPITLPAGARRRRPRVAWRSVKMPMFCGHLLGSISVAF